MLVTSGANSAVKAARKLAARRGRERAREFLVEGPAVVAEAVGHLRRLFVTAEAASWEASLVEAAAGAGAEVVLVSDGVLAQIATTVTPMGLVGVAALPTPDLAGVLEGATLVVVGVRVADPGNVGTIVRTADAAGADAVVLTDGSVDPRGPKAVRASAGSVFHLPVVDGQRLDDVLDTCRARGLALVAADGAAQLTYTEADLCAPTALLFGNEAHGLPAAALGAADAVVSVPIRRRAAGSAESLNLAAAVAVVTYEAARQRRMRGAALGSGP